MRGDAQYANTVPICIKYIYVYIRWAGFNGSTRRERKPTQAQINGDAKSEKPKEKKKKKTNFLVEPAFGGCSYIPANYWSSVCCRVREPREPSLDRQEQHGIMWRGGGAEQAGCLLSIQKMLLKDDEGVIIQPPNH